MAKWEEIGSKNWRSHIAKTCYTFPHFPVKVREILASWLEAPKQEQIWKWELSHNKEFVESMRNELQSRVLTDPNKEMHLGVLENFQQAANSDPKTLFHHVKESLKRERLEVEELRKLHNRKRNASNCVRGQQSENSTVSGSLHVEAFSRLNLKVHQLSQRAKDVCQWASEYHGLQQKRSELRAHQQLQLEQWQWHNSHHSEFSSSTQSELTKTLESTENELQNVMARLFNDPSLSFKTMMFHLERVNEAVTSELQHYDEEQPLVALLGESSEATLNEIEKWYREVLECLEILHENRSTLWSAFQQLSPDSNSSGIVQRQLEKVEEMYQQIKKPLLIFDKQPNPVIRKDAGFEVKMRVFPFVKNMKIEAVSKLLLNDVEAWKLNTEPNYIPKTCGKLKPGKRGKNLTIENNRIEFGCLKVADLIRGVKRTQSRKRSKSAVKISHPTRGVNRGKARGKGKKKKADAKLVTDEQYHIHFQVYITDETGQKYTATALTVPFGIITHTVQSGDAYATFLWYNALEKDDRAPFSQLLHPKSVAWTELIKLIDLLFLKVGRRLSDENKAYLEKILFEIKVQPLPGNGMVSYEQFCKETFRSVNINLLNEIPPKSEIVTDENGEKYKNFPFWTWLWSTLELLSFPELMKVSKEPKLKSEGLRNLWKDGKILGMTTVKDINKKLHYAEKKAPKTHQFILRFPEGKPESIGVYSLRTDPASSEKGIVTLAYFAKDLNKLPLNNRIIDNDDLTHLYPNEKKEGIFQRISSGDENSSSHYIQVPLIEKSTSSLILKFRKFSIDEDTPVPSASRSGVPSSSTMCNDSPMTCYNNVSSPSLDSNVGSSPLTTYNCATNSSVGYVMCTSPLTGCSSGISPSASTGYVNYLSPLTGCNSSPNSSGYSSDPSPLTIQNSTSDQVEMDTENGVIPRFWMKEGVDYVLKSILEDDNDSDMSLLLSLGVNPLVETEH